ncbi:sulfatase-like hydrolase/transferase [Bacteroidota bacterium]
MKTILYGFALCWLILSTGCSPQKPNIIIFLADDLGYADLGSYGCDDIKTPNIDKLSEQGVRFTNFYANGPECTPTRTALLSGYYQQRIGGLECAIGAGNVGRYPEAQWLSERKEHGLPPEYATLPFSLKEAGYTTAIFGKWHLGYEEKFRPNNNGFDYSFGPIGYGGDYFYHVEQDPINQDDFDGAHSLAQNGQEIFRDGEYMTDLITEEAIEWIKIQDKKKPFFAFLTYTSPHTPFQGPEDDLGRPLQGEEWTFRNREIYIEMVEAMDKGIGKILALTKEIQLDEKTIVIFFSDNGGTRISNNGPLRGIKGQVYEGGIRVPCIIRWPGNIPEHTVSHQSSLSFDLTRSILELIGTNSEELNLDGYDIIDHVTQNTVDFERTMYWRLKRSPRVRKAVRDGNYKYIIELDSGKVFREHLFNLENDLAEQNDLLVLMPDKVDSLREKIARWEEEVKAPRLEEYYNK